ncbi:MAG TPA: phosphoribosylamine--glycine ligase [Gemmatimonadaceae bacterium]|jgi:phosphoribosylamine--glycine ligase|nr:phosphoribosylamine--glycine ligase [Gemmatimonadaceae bacterium]
MKILIVGGGGREHALAWKLCRDDPTLEILAAPGNPGISKLARCIPIASDKYKELADLAEDEFVDLTIVGPEQPLEGGIVNLFQSRGLPIFGPTREAARIETSKRFAKELMGRAGIPTARASQHSDAKEAKAALANFSTPVVIKASGLASGKGVIVALSTAEAERAIDSMLSDRVFGNAGREILIEEFMEGEEISLFAISDGHQALPLLAAQDHKRLLEGDRGPNTGGMGAYAPTSLATPELVTRVMAEIIRPTLAALREAGSAFKGLLYAGLMITADGPKVVEFNCRFGDPETQTLMPLMDSSLVELIAAVAAGGSLSRARYPDWKPLTSVTTVVASAGYPDKARTGDVIELPAPENGVEVFHAGTAIDPATNQLVTAGGRVLAVTAVSESLIEAAELSRSYAERISINGKQLRRDIAWRELSRGARVT